jgi:O-antigen/teichoic acid export membrane protein
MTGGLAPEASGVGGHGSHRRALWSATGLTAAASTTANVLGYLFNMVMTRSLGVQGYGELATLLAVIIVATVPATALQAAIARRITNGRTPVDLMRTTVLVAGSVAAIVCLASPALKAAFAIGSYGPLLWTAGSLVPTTIGFAWLGVLQGRRRFLALGILLIGTQLVRVVGGVVARIVHPTSSGALGAVTLLTAVLIAAVTPWVLTLAEGESDRRLLPEVLRDIAPIFGVLVLSNLDLFLARHYLNSYDSGIYAAGNLITRAFFWGPAFIAMSSYPHLAVPHERRHALRHSSALLLVVAVLGIVASVVGAELVPLFLGGGYRPVAQNAWLFAADGLALAGLQFAVYAGLAVHDRRIGRLVWLVAATECGIVAAGLHDSTRQIIVVALAGGLVLLIASVLLEIRRVPQPR